jgi:hypothetical protein
MKPNLKQMLLALGVLTLTAQAIVPALADDDYNRGRRWQEDNDRAREQRREIARREEWRRRHYREGYEQPRYVYAPPPVYYAPPPRPPVIDFVFPLHFR